MKIQDDPGNREGPHMSDELMLDSVGPSAKGGFEIKTHAGGPETSETLLFIADSMRATLDAHDAPNYLEMEVKASDGKRYIMTLQRAGKLTPHSARLAAEEALEAAKPRAITTAEELDGLPVGSVVNTDAGAWEKASDPDDADDITFWLQAGNRRWNPSRDVTLPATVLHEPTP
jgi:hypothetical protein